MCDRAIAPLLEGLRSSNASDAWVEFLQWYGPVLYQAARTHTSSQDVAAECYVYICEQLAHNRFKRLLKFNPKGRASFTTWLRVVVRNLCFDWQRSQSGRHRPFKSLAGLSPLELEIYHWRFAQGASQQETLQQLAPQFPGVDLDELSAVEGHLQNSLSSRQRWILSARRQSEISTPVAVAGEESELGGLDVPDQQPDQETQLITHQQRGQLQKNLALLPPAERLMLQLRFEHDLSLDEVARLCGLGDGQLEKLEEVDYEGGVKVEVALSAQMIEVRTGTQVWADSADETGRVDQRNVPAVVSEMSSAMDRAINKLLLSFPTSALASSRQ